MKLSKAVLLSSALLAACAVYWTTKWIRGGPAPEAPVKITIAQALRVDDLLTETKDAGSARPGRITVTSDTGASVLGFVAARVFREKDGEPDPDDWCDLAAVQLKDTLDLRPWMRMNPAAGRCFLAVTARLASDAGETYAVGWTRIEVPAVGTSAWTLKLASRSVRRIEVRTVDGAPVPGALVEIVPTEMLENCAASHLVFTGADGSVVVHWPASAPRGRARLAAGVGPSEKVISAPFDDKSDHVTLTADVRGGWKFHPAAVRMLLPGSSTRVVSVAGTRPEAPVYAVSRWVGPGRGPETPLWLMTLGSSPGVGAGATIEFAKRLPIPVADVTTHPVLVLGADGRRTEDAASTAHAGARSTAGRR